MKVRVAYTVDANDIYRRAINCYYGKPGLASREDVVSWQRMHGSSMDDDVMHEFWGKVKRREEPVPEGELYPDFFAEYIEDEQ